MRATVAVVAIALGSVLVGGTSALAAVPNKAHKLPEDACALLTDAQVATVVPSAAAKPEPGTATQVSCFWSAGAASLAVSVYKVKSTAAAKAALRTSAKKRGVKPLKGVGDFAYQSDTKYLSHVAVVVGTLQLSIDFSPGHPPTSSDNANALSIAKTVAKHV